MNDERILRDNTIQEPTPAQRSRAVRSTAHHARDAQELAELLDMLDLAPEEGLPQPRKSA